MWNIYFSKFVPRMYICKNENFMKKVLFVLLLLVVALAVVPIFLPKTMFVEEEFVVDGSIEEVYNHFNDLKKFTQFNAWTEQDSTIAIEYSSPSYGEGAWYKWNSDKSNIGEGSMKIAETKANEFIFYDLSFGKSEGNRSEIVLQSLDDEKTRVVWSFSSGEMGYPMQILNVLMKGSVKSNIKKSLENLNTMLALPGDVNYSNQDVEKGGFQMIEQEPKKLFGIIQDSGTSPEELNMAIAESFGLVHSYLVDAQGLTDEQIGKPVVLWKELDKVNDQALFYCGYIFKQEVPEADELEYTDVPGGKLLTTFHNGDRNVLDVTHKRLRTFAEVQGLELANDVYNVYLNSPDEVDTQALKTQVFIPIIE